ncbi:MAG: hypothetical protein ACJAY7_001806 [Pseudohongiellaceae bacterium]|jgi:hypothetical protein
MSKNLFQIRFYSIVLLLLSSVCIQVSAQTEYSSRLLNTKRIFSQGLAEALAQPFNGVVTSQGKQAGLFPVISTGVTTEPLVNAASAFLKGLSSIHLAKVQFAIDDPEWRNWSNVDVGIFPRYGLSLEEMSEPQKAAAWKLITSSLSVKGVENVRNIMKTEQRLLEMNNEPIRYGEEKYYITIMGIPGAEEPWGWQLDGHHLVINFFVLGDQVVMTPVFWGGEPVSIEAGRYAGSTIMQQEQSLGLAFMQSLSGQQRQQATLDSEKRGNNQLAAANQDNLVLDYAGIKAGDLTSMQRLELLTLIEVYIGNMKSGHAEVTLEQIASHLDDTYFSWIGDTAAGSVFYYRIHSPVILIEFDHQNPVGTTVKNQAGRPSRDHIHAIVRTPNGNDYGKDLLAQHLRRHSH